MQKHSGLKSDELSNTFSRFAPYCCLQRGVNAVHVVVSILTSLLVVFNAEVSSQFAFLKMLHSKGDWLPPMYAPFDDQFVSIHCWLDIL